MLRIGVIGVGHLGSIHASLWSKVPEVRLIGVVDADAASAARIAESAGTKAYDSVTALLRDVDAVSIVTPTRSHAAVALEALAAGVHCFIEKPIAATVSDARAISALATVKKLVVQVGHIERFNPALLALGKMILEPLFIESHRLAQYTPRATDVPVVHDLMIHDIDVILSLVHSPVARLDANGVSVVSDATDIANARIQFENGCVANVTASRISQSPMRKMRIFQQDAYISIDFAAPKVEVFRLVDDADAAGATMKLGEIEKGSRKRTIIFEQPAVSPVNALQFELEQFRNSIANGSPVVVTADEGIRALEIAEKIVDMIKG